MLKECKGYVSIWVGEMTAKEAKAYLKETYDDDEPISRFAEDLGETFYDHDFLETARERKPCSIDKLLADSSYSRSFVEAARKLAAKAGVRSANFGILMFDVRLQRKKWPKTAPLKYLGDAKYSLQTAPAKHDNFDYRGHEARVISMAFAPDGQTLATGDCEGNVLAWNAEQGRAIAHPRTLFAGACSDVYRLYFSANGQRCAASSLFQSRVWDEFPSGDLWPLLKTSIRGVNGQTNLLGLDRSAGQLITINLRDGKTVRQFEIDCRFVTALAGNQWAAVNKQNELVIGSFGSKAIKRRPTKLAFDNADDLAADPLGSTVVVWHDGSLEIHDLIKDQVRRAANPDREIRLVCMDHSSTMLVAPYNAPMEVWSYRSGKQSRTLDTGKVFYSRVGLSDDGKVALGVENNGDSLDLWQLPSGKRLARLTKKDLKLKKDGISTAALAHSGELLAVGMLGGGVRFFRVEKSGIAPLE